MNVQFAVQVQDGKDVIYVLEVNPRASRTVPFVSKAIGRPLAKIAAQVMAGKTLAELNATDEIIPPYFSVKEAVFPFNKFPGVDPVLSPEMRSTGEVMGVGKTFGEALFKSQLAASSRLPASGKVFISVKDTDKPAMTKVAKELIALGYTICATGGTATHLADAGVAVEKINKVKDGRPHIVDAMKNGEVALVFTTVDETASSISDSSSIRKTAIAQRITYQTTVAGAEAAIEGMKQMHQINVYDLQGLHRSL
jgi:carbamoyl-phosphate synthase large subunit